MEQLIKNPYIHDYIHDYVVAAAFLVSVFVFFFYLHHRKQKDEKRKASSSFKFLDYNNAKKKNFKQDQKEQEKYYKQESFLKSNGIYYAYKEKISPDEYKAIRVIIAILVGIVISMFSPILALPGVFVGYLIPDMIVKQGNSSDNSAMLESIKEVYDTMRIQTRNNVHISTALYECYLCVKHPRLKQALLELTIEIQGNGDINAAVQNFREKFDNPYLESLAVSIKQSLETGKAAQIFSDVSKQIDAIEEAILIREESRVQTVNTLVQTLVYASVIVVIIYFVILVFLEAFGGVFA